MTPLSFTLTPADFTELHRYGLRHITSIQRSYALRTLAIFILAWLIAAIIQYIEQGFIPRIFYVAAGLALFPGIALIAGFFYSNVGNLSYRMLMQSHGKAMLTQTITLDERGLRQQWGQVETLWQFAAFGKALESQNLYLFYLIPDYRALVVPKRAFDTPEAGQAFFEAVKAKITPTNVA